MADAHQQVDDAERHGTPDDVIKARAYLSETRELCGQLGALLINYALDLRTLEVQRKLSDLFNGMSVSAYRESRLAHERAATSEGRIDALEQRVRELEARLDELTPGVGDPITLGERRR